MGEGKEVLSVLLLKALSSGDRGRYRQPGSIEPNGEVIELPWKRKYIYVLSDVTRFSSDVSVFML